MNPWLRGLCLAAVGGWPLACAPTSSEVGQEPDGDSMTEGQAGHSGASGGSIGSGNGNVAGDANGSAAGDANGSADGREMQCSAGTKRLAADGCNSCTCLTNGDWDCTDLACACTQGATRPAGDGCNTCTCQNGAWSCSMKACDVPKCELGATQSDGCTSCLCLDSGEGATWACTSNVCLDKCEPGEMKSAGCNGCLCNAAGQWDCTTRSCNDDCSAGLADCDGDPANACETDLATSVMNCGLCGNYCAQAGATSKCVAGKCEIDVCMAGYADCNYDPTDGCEATVGAGGCQNRCELRADAPAPAPATGDCNCPAGTTCVQHGRANPDGDYCLPLPQTCPSYGTCGCMGPCACDEGWEATCTERMQLGERMVVDCTGTRD